jgi:hypothetical protein
LLDHREPLFLDSAGNLKLERFASQYKGLSPRHTVEIGPHNDPGLRDEQVAHLKGVQQGTISVKAINRAVLQAAAAVATATTATNTNAVAYKDTKDIRDTKPDTKTDTKSDFKSDTKPLLTSEESKSAAAAKPVAESSESRAASEKKSGTGMPNPVALPDSESPTTRTLSAKAVDEPGTTTGTTSDDMRSAQALSTAAPSATVVVAVRDADVRVSSSDMQDWISAWQSRSGHIGMLFGGLVALSIALIAQKRFSVRPRRMRRLRTLFLLFTVGFIGWTAQGQLTIVNITAAIESLSSDGDLSFFLNDPMTVILWVFVGLTLLVWGRGTFCGWLCPFGALQELISLLANALGRRQRRLRAALDARLKWIKYLILAALMVSLYASPPMAEWLVEVEPFKTAISLYFVRDWPYLAWAVFCLLLSVFVYRGYCRYLCPLGAALASLGFLRVWSWIPRRSECGTPCQTCRHRCEYQAITPAGKIDYRECFQCLDCVSIYQDPQRCFPLIRAEKKAEQLA